MKVVITGGFGFLGLAPGMSAQGPDRRRAGPDRIGRLLRSGAAGGICWLM